MVGNHRPPSSGSRRDNLGLRAPFRLGARGVQTFDLEGRPGDSEAVRASLPLLSIGLSLVASGCASSLPSVWVTDLPLETEVERIVTGDTLEVQVKGQEKLSGSFPVRQNGTFAQPVVGDFPAVGLTEQEVAQALSKALDGIVVNPLVTVSIAKRRPVTIPVLGEVTNVGVVTIELGDGLLDVMALVSGLSDFASRTGIYVIRREPRLVRIRFDYDALLGGERKHVEFKLKEGDVIVVK